MSSEMKDLEFEIEMTSEVAKMFRPTQNALFSRIRKILKKRLANASDGLKAEFKGHCETNYFKAVEKKPVWGIAFLEAGKLNLV